MFKKSIITILFASTLLFLGCSSEDEVQQANDMVSKNEFVLTALDNKQYVVKKEGTGFVLKDAKGKVVIFDIFATWCPPCKKAAIHLSSLQEKYGDDLVIIGITIEDNLPNTTLQTFREQYEANYILVNSDRNRPLADSIVDELKLGDRYPIPIMALYKDGKYINHYIGSIEEEFIQNDIDLALGLK